MATEIRGVIGDDDEMKGPGGDRGFAAGADVRLAGGIRLHRHHRHVEGAPAVHASAPEHAPEDQRHRDRHCDHHQNHVRPSVGRLSEGIETHAATLHGTGPVSGTVVPMPWITTNDRGPVRWMTLSSPGRRNAVPSEGWAELAAALEAFEQAESRVLVIVGAGEDFCAGADLDPLGGRDQGVMASHRRMKMVAEAATRLHRLTKPTVAAVDGVAVGAGLNLALGCDVVIATTRARFSEIFVRRGLTVDFGGTWLLPRIVGLQRAKEMALTGRIVDAREAKRIGLCLELVEPSELAGRAAELAESFLAGAPIAQSFAKQGIDSAWEVSFEEAVGWEGQSQSICLNTEDFGEGVAAFLEKRPPEFRGH